MCASSIVERRRAHLICSVCQVVHPLHVANVLQFAGECMKLIREVLQRVVLSLIGDLAIRWQERRLIGSLQEMLVIILCEQMWCSVDDLKRSRQTKTKMQEYPLTLACVNSSSIISVGGWNKQSGGGVHQGTGGSRRKRIKKDHEHRSGTDGSSLPSVDMYTPAACSLIDENMF